MPREGDLEESPSFVFGDEAAVSREREWKAVEGNKQLVSGQRERGLKAAERGARSCMKVFIQDLRTMEFLKQGGGWCQDVSEARIFASSVDALEVCVTKQLNHVQIVLRFSNGHPHDEMSIPLEDNRKETGDRKGEPEP